MLPACTFLVLAQSACRRPAASPATPTKVLPAPESASAPAKTVPIPPQNVIPDRKDVADWVFVEKLRADTPDGWVRGKFDQKRNRISIETHGALGFAIDMERIPIDWKRLVVIRIDGRNSELRKREYPRYHFQRDEYGRWIVAE